MSPYFNLFLVFLFVAKTKCTSLLEPLNEFEANDTSDIILKYSSYFKPCSVSDPQLNDCIEENIREGGPTFAKGVPELGIPPLDPVKLGIIKLNNPSLKLIFSDAELTGLSNFQLNSFTMNVEGKKAALDITANVSLRGHYYMDGEVLLLPVKGDGQARIKITNLNIKLKYKYEVRDGIWKIVEYKNTHKMEKANFKFTNMFGGHNLELAKTIHLVLNENWQLVMTEIAPDVTKHIIDTCAETVNKFYAAVPASELIKP